ncbi:hypothetical protein [Thermoactinospora rubra]|uniref:hypothetical protein n=1 Tax=Thermoactinospora rubra TaxID=1088767 RepID=UPI000A113AA1|nr:hypothetical protein [Thermoactinospora rubra]
MTGQLETAFRPLIPATVIIDSRNLAGQAAEVLGARRYPTVPGVEAALRMYGFAAHQVIAAVATRADGGAGTWLAREIRRNCDYAQRIEDAGGHVLRGYLREKFGRPEEKQVDVLCARAIASAAYAARHEGSPSRAIVLLSKDADLTPMSEFAHTLDVPVYFAAPSVVHNRNLDHWLLLGQAALAVMTEARGTVGHGLRDQIARLAFERWDRPYDWTVSGFATRQGREVVQLRNAAGVPGTVPLAEFGGCRPAPRSVHRLYPAGVDLGERNAEFPWVALARCAPAVRDPNLLKVKVVERIGPTLVSVDLPGGPRGVKVDVPVDNVAVGRAIVVYDDGYRARFVGGLEGVTSGASPLLTPLIAEITGFLPGTGVAKAVLADGRAVVARLPRGFRGGIGARYVTVAAGETRDGNPLYQAVSSPLVP